MRVKIHIHKVLQKYTNGLASYECEAKDFIDVKNALKNIFPKFNDYFSLVLNGSSGENLAFLDKNKKVITNSYYEINTLKKDHTELYLIPLIYGSGKMGKTLAIIAVIALAAYGFHAAGGFDMLSSAFGGGAGGAGGGLASFFTPQKLFGMVFRLIISQIISSLNKPPKRPTETDAPVRRNNNIFEGLINTTAPGTNISMHYGQMRVSGQLLSGFVETLNHPKDGDPNVIDRFGTGE
jgi:predicted phage tail protein